MRYLFQLDFASSFAMDSATKKVSRLELWNLIQDVKGDKQAVVLQEHLVREFKCELSSSNILKTATFISKVKKKLENDFCRNKVRFSEGSHWLEGFELFELGCPSVKSGSISASTSAARSSTPSTSGAPSKDYAECSERSKRRKVQNLRAAHSTDELIDAAIVELNQKGMKDAASILQECTQTTPTIIAY